jgi:hypothetical protein
MNLFKGLACLIPGVRHIAAGWPLAGAAWFAAFLLPLNFGILAPIAWPGRDTRLARVVLLGVALVVAWMSHRRAARAERLASRLEGRRQRERDRREDSRHAAD